MARLLIQNLSVAFRAQPVLKGVNLDVGAVEGRGNEILSCIGPAHSGKTTLLRAINRLDEGKPGYVRTGEIRLNDRRIEDWNLARLRRHVGIVFATPLPLPGTIRHNLTYGPRLKGIHARSELAMIAERSLRAAFLWDEVKDRLDTSALRLSGGQQQRLCIARTLAVNPEIIMMDEPCSGLDPISTAQVEAAMRELKDRYTFMLVTNNTKQAARVSDRVAFFLGGELVEIGTPEQVFTRPRDQRTDDYVSGRIG